MQPPLVKLVWLQHERDNTRNYRDCRAWVRDTFEQLQLQAAQRRGNISGRLPSTRAHHLGCCEQTPNPEYKTDDVKHKRPSHTTIHPLHLICRICDLEQLPVKNTTVSEPEERPAETARCTGIVF